MLRSPTLMKGYVAVFVCFTAKVVHLELYTNLRKKSFLAFARFIGRRGYGYIRVVDLRTSFLKTPLTFST